MAATEDFARAIYHLQIWGYWRRVHRGSATRGYPSRSAGLATGGSSEEFDNLLEREDAKSAAIADSVIDQLSELHRRALEHRYIYQGVFKSNRTNADQTLQAAHAAFWALGKRNLC